MSAKTIFISYRRGSAASALAQSIKSELTSRGYDVFLDVGSMTSGPWQEQISREISRRSHFLLLLTEDALHRCGQPQDWLAMEIDLARKTGRNIVPIREGSVDILKLRATCPPNIRHIFDFQMAELRLTAFQPDIEALVDRFIAEHRAPGAMLAPPNFPMQAAERPSGRQAALSDGDRSRLTSELDSAGKSYREMLAIGEDASELSQRILDLKRRLREGGQLHQGDVLGEGRYLLIKRVGRGGFATVWEANDRETEEHVAIKILHAELAGDPVRRGRFFRGARIMADLPGEHVVRVLAAEGIDGGFHYFVMEFLCGGDLREHVLRKRPTVDEALGFSLRIAGALAHTHRSGLVHRDVKPTNILLDSAGVPKLTDFDLVGAKDTTGGTHTGAIGTFLYASPELMTRPQDATPPADVYGLAATTIFMLQGADLTHEFIRRPDEVVDRLPCSDAVKRVLKRAIDVEPNDRYSDAGAFRDALVTAKASPHNTNPNLEPIEGIQWIWIPPGEFLMGASAVAGAPGYDPERWNTEIQARRMSLSEGFFIAKHPITNGNYKRFLQETGLKPPEYWTKTQFNTERQPVVGISCEDVFQFRAWLSSKVPEGFSVRLPTEAQWEYAARGTDGRRYPWGTKAPTSRVAVFGRRFEDGPAPIGERPGGASPFGCEDMVGNVWEFCNDMWDSSIVGQNEIPLDRHDARSNTGPWQVVRGGAWDVEVRQLRITTRTGYVPWKRAGNIGFRLVVQVC